MLDPGTSNPEIFKYRQVSYAHHVYTTVSKTINTVKLSEQSSSRPSRQNSNQCNLKHVTYTPSSGTVLCTGRWHLIELVLRRYRLNRICVSDCTMFRCGRKTAKATISSSCLPVLPPGVHNSVPTGRMSIKFDIWWLFENMSKKVQVSLKSDNNNG
jgi:hypothetical protein